MVPPSPPEVSGSSRAVVSFETLAQRKDADLDVALGAALVARDVYPELDVTRVLAELDRLAAPLVGTGVARTGAEQAANALATLLYEHHGFRGNEAEYYDPKNSLLSDVLVRKLGIPLSLGIIYCEVARRIGVTARGVGFPGHYLVRIERRGVGEKPLIVDPFFAGRVLDEAELRTRLQRTIGDGTGELTPYLAPSSSRAILVRMLTNLKAIYLTRNERARAHLALDRIACLLPDAAGPLVDRGLLAVQLGAHESARSDMTRALTLHPTAGEERTARAELAKLAKKPSALN